MVKVVYFAEGLLVVSRQQILFLDVFDSVVAVMSENPSAGCTLLCEAGSSWQQVGTVQLSHREVSS